MYRHGDAVIRPLVEVYRVEESLAALLNSRSTDLAYEKVRVLPVDVAANAAFGQRLWGCVRAMTAWQFHSTLFFGYIVCIALGSPAPNTKIPERSSYVPSSSLPARPFTSSDPPHPTTYFFQSWGERRPALTSSCGAWKSSPRAKLLPSALPLLQS